MQALRGSPYSLQPEAGEEARARFRKFEDRVALLRSIGRLSQDTLERYYKESRFLQVAESNALEGSTLNEGETKEAVLTGITISGHDPEYSKDACNLDNAIKRLTELARDRERVPDVAEVKEIHSIIVQGKGFAGEFREDRVTITGSRHSPPKTWGEIVDQMNDWEAWSRAQCDASPILRAAVLHTWLVSIHPFIDGNGRTSRAVMNLELIRAGLPPIIIRKKDRPRYLDGLRHSDDAGDIGPLLDLFVARADDALTRLERVATVAMGYDPVRERVRERQRQQLNIWTTAVRLLVEQCSLVLTELLEPLKGQHSVKWYEDGLELDDYVKLCQGQSIPRSWVVEFAVSIPALPPIRRLLWAGYRSDELGAVLGG